MTRAGVFATNSATARRTGSPHAPAEPVDRPLATLRPSASGARRSGSRPYGARAVGTLLNMRHRVLPIAFAAVVLVAAFGAAAVADAARSRASLAVTPSVVRRGHDVLVRGNAARCPRGDAVTILSRAFVHTHDFAGVPAVYAHAGAAGRFSVKTRIPSSRSVGRYTVTARCGGGNLGVLAYLTVRA